MTLVVVILTVAPIVYESSQDFKIAAVERDSQANLEQARARSTEIESLFISYIDKTNVISGLLLKNYATPAEKEKELALSFKDDRDLVSVEVISLKVGVKAKNINRVVNEEYLKEYKLDKSYIDRLRVYQEESNRFQFQAVFAGEVEIRNSTIRDGAPMISIGIPLILDELSGSFSHIAIAEVRLDRLQKAFQSSNGRMTFLVDSQGSLLAHPEEDLVFKAQNMIVNPAVALSLRSKARNAQVEKSFNDPFSKEETLAAFARTSLNITVISQTSMEKILRAGKEIERKAIYTTGRVISIAIFIIFLFSISLTSPIEKLVDMAMQVAKGNFKVNSGVKSKDEVGALASAFDEMVRGLVERDKVKNVLNKFHGSAITEDLLKGNLELGGSNKEVTVFFSDIRDFTKFSEGHTPEQVVDMLNEYFKVMVGIINKNGGVVDKFIGDAIMAVWGAPEKSENDPFNCVKACLEMRVGLDKLNEKRVARGEIPIKVGAGIHTGHVISGTIGSDERMEYTVIGDAVNTAARIEASTKAFGTDLLISGGTCDIIKEKFLIEEAGQVEVKGKSEALRLYKVRGYYDTAGNKVEITTAYSDYEIGHDAKVKKVS